MYCCIMGERVAIKERSFVKKCGSDNRRRYAWTAVPSFFANHLPVYRNAMG